MNARRSLFLMVAIAILLLVTSLGLATQLRKVAAITNDLINAYSALDSWSQLVVSTNSAAANIEREAQKVLHYLPKTLGEDNRLSTELSSFLANPKPDATALRHARVLKDVLIWELFECHRLQNMYSSWTNIAQIFLTLIVLSIGVAAYFMGRRAQDYRLAPFPEANPNPVLGLNNQGDLIYVNRAGLQSMQRADELNYTVEDILPKQYSEKLKELAQSGKVEDTWVQPFGGRILQYKVQRLPKLDRIHIYSEDITEQEEIRARNEFIAYHDPVCLLANRQRIEQIIDELNDPDRPITLVLTFVSGMAKVVTTQGLTVADQFAREMSIRLRAAYQTIVTNDQNKPIIFRFDGNLFGCLYFKALTPREHVLLEKALDTSVEQPFQNGQRDYFFSIQSGAVCEPSSISARKLIQQGNLALHAIHDRECCYQLFDAEIESEIHTTDKLEQALQHAIELGELEMVYQPQQSLGNNQLLGFEALMRWHHKGKTISPMVFIPIAEKDGLIHSLGLWAFRTVLKQSMDWQLTANVEAGVIAVNVSAQEFTRTNFIEDIELALSEFPANPKHIQIELTESSLIADEQVAIAKMHQLKEIGFTLAIDDFGTGYSSFSYLSRFPIDKLKIDRSFVANLKNGARDEAIVSAMVEVAHQLSIQVIAEGVETELERKILVNRGCDQIQGYLYGRPMSLADASLFASTPKEAI